MIYIYLQSSLFISFVVAEICPGKCVKKQSVKTSKVGTVELRFFCSALLLNDISLRTTFAIYTYCSCITVSWKMCEKTAITSKLSKAALWFFRTAFLLNEIYVSTKF